MACADALRAVLDDLGERSLLQVLFARFGRCELLDHWKQGEFHHDLVFALPEGAPAPFLVASTNCNGGVKDLLALAGRPERWALWHRRCPENPAFAGALPAVVAEVRHHHWFDPCELLRPDARSELRPDARRRQRGGGWMALDADEEGEAG